jgi:hypothetical protein
VCVWALNAWVGFSAKSVVGAVCCAVLWFVRNSGVGLPLPHSSSSSGTGGLLAAKASIGDIIYTGQVHWDMPERMAVCPSPCPGRKCDGSSGPGTSLDCP